VSASIFILTLDEASNIEACLKWVVMPLVKPLVEISDEVWICADDFVGPNVSVGNRAIVGSFSVDRLDEINIENVFFVPTAKESDFQDKRSCLDQA
jgi:hypothetical protein